jgi:methylthioxylose transferase
MITQERRESYPLTRTRSLSAMSSGAVSLERGNEERADLIRWSALVVVALAAGWLALRLHARLGTAGVPFDARYRFEVNPRSLLAPLVAAGTLLAAARGWTERLPWRVLLLAMYAAAAGWALALAVVDGAAGLSGPVRNPEEYLVDVPRVDDRPGAFVRGFLPGADRLSPATRGHPPLPVLLLWLLRRAGVTSPVALGVVLTLLGALTVPLVLVAVRSLAGEEPARRLGPVLALAPYAVWVAVSMDGVTATLGAAVVAAGTVGSEHGRRWWDSTAWAAAGGLLLGLSALFSYAVVWLAASVICTYFVRRRPLLNVVSAGCSLVPILLAQAAGFGWTDGLLVARRDLMVRLGPARSAAVWALLGLAVLVIVCGPALVTSLRKLRMTPGWPFLVGAAGGIGFAVLAGLSRGEAERAWLPFFPWLVIAAVAPTRRGGPPPPVPLWLAGAGALAGIVLQAVLASPW